MIKFNFNKKTMTKIAINSLRKVGLLLFLFLLIPNIANADMIVFVSLYYPFSSDIIEWNFWLSLIIFLAGLVLELILIFLFIRKNINVDKKKKTVFKIFVPIIILNLFTIYLTQIIALFIGFFAEIFPIIVEFIIIYIIFRKAKRKGLLIGRLTKRSIFMLVFFANLLSFVFGFLVNFAYYKCEYGYFDLMPMNGNYESIPSHCSYLPIAKERIERAKFKVDKEIEEKKYEDSIIDECEKRKDKTSCYVEYAVRDDNMELCYFAEDKDACYREFAMRTLDYMACRKIKINNRDKSNMISCYYDLAIAMKIAGKEFEENCASIGRLEVGDVIASRCYQLEKIEMIDYKKCERRKNKADCYVECAIKDNNIGLCYFTEDKDICYKKFATETLDPTACEKIEIKRDYTNVLDIANCYYDMAVSRKMAGRKYENICSSIEEQRDEAEKFGVYSTKRLELIIDKCYQLKKDK